MRHGLMLFAVALLAACSDKAPTPPPAVVDAGVVEDAGVPPSSGVERPEGALERPPGDRLPDDLRPPGR